MSSIVLESLVSEPAQTILEVDSGMITVGRDTDNTMVVDSEAVSRTHACFFDVHGQWFYRDLNSTNGSAINGVKVIPAQIRLLRDGDRIQIADFPVRLRIVPSGADAETVTGYGHQSSRVPVLYVFNGDQFETEFPLATSDSRFVIGGPDGHLYIEGEATETSLAEIALNNSRLEISSGFAATAVIVNGMAVAGVAALGDRDEIEIGPYRIVASDPNSQQVSKDKKSVGITSPTETPSIQAHAGTKPRDWDTDESRRKVIGNRKFVFGTTPEEDEVSGTIAIRARDFQVRRADGGGAEVSSQHRFSKSGNYKREEGAGLSERTQMILGAVVLLLLVAATLYFVLL